MMAFYCFAGLLVFGVIALIAFGLYEFYIEEKLANEKHNLHLKHLDKINRDH